MGKKSDVLAAGGENEQNVPPRLETIGIRVSQSSFAKITLVNTALSQIGFRVKAGFKSSGRISPPVKIPPGMWVHSQSVNSYN